MAQIHIRTSNFCYQNGKTHRKSSIIKGIWENLQKKKNSLLSLQFFFFPKWTQVHSRTYESLWKDALLIRYLFLCQIHPPDCRKVFIQFMKNSDTKNCNLQQEVKSKVVFSSSSKLFIISMGTEAHYLRLCYKAVKSQELNRFLSAIPWSACYMDIPPWIM